MKKIKIEGKLNLNKETVTKLNNEQMNLMRGGAGVDALAEVENAKSRKFWKCTKKCTAYCVNDDEPCVD